jgi:adenine-specific DNA-methyltransferase
MAPNGHLFGRDPGIYRRATDTTLRADVETSLKRKDRTAQPSLFDAWTEPELIGAALELGARTVTGWHPSEEHVAACAEEPYPDAVNGLGERIRSGGDPLGDILISLRSPVARRRMGATYTPHEIVRAMMAWASRQAEPARVIDPGCGSARFLLEAGRVFDKARLVGVEIDPVASILARASLAAAGYAARSEVRVGDFRAHELPKVDGRTLFIGNPPYVRHHGIEQPWKEWLTAGAATLGYKASQLAGLHVHFFLSIALKARPADFGALITAAEWLDVNYGSLVRELFLNQLGGQGIVVVDPTANPFPDAAVTGAVTYFEAGARPSRIMLTRVKELGDLYNSKYTSVVRRERLGAEHRWSHMTRAARAVPAGFVELGELCRVHRGAVTGANKVWIAGEHSKRLPERLLAPTVTRAREIIEAGEDLIDASSLRRVIDLPECLDVLDDHERREVDSFLRVAQRLGGDRGYVAQNRKAWWSVGLRKPAPILATYMARRPPGFVLNNVEARHLNIAHGLYPREPFAPPVLRALVGFLSKNIDSAMGRTYAGGLTKFEPREMERVLVPTPDVLLQLPQ